MRKNNFAGGTGEFQEGRMLLFSPLGQCRVEPCDFDLMGESSPFLNVFVSHERRVAKLL
jgi:hypothetical protein